MGMITRLASGAAILATATAAATATVTMFLPAAAEAAQPDGGLALELRSVEPTYRPGEPVRLVFAVTNTWNEACGLADVAVGTVQVVSVRRDGVELVPALGRSFFEDGIDAEIASGMVAVEPGAAVDVELASGRLAEGGDPDSAVLRSVTATASGAGVDALWPVGAPGRYEVTAGYTVPGVDADVAPCAGSAAAGTVGFTVGAAGDDPGPPAWLWVLLGVLLALAVAGFIVVLLVRRRHTSAAAALMLVGVAVVVAAGGEPAQADVQVDPNSGIPVEGVDFRAAVNGCFEKFDAPGGDPAGVMGRLRDPDTPRVRIIPTSGGSGAFETPRSPDGEGSSTVTWNPTSTEAYGDGVARDPCAALYHELVHADDISRDAVPEGECGNTGIPTAEVRATLAENEYRRSQGLPPRTEYDGHRLPESMDECDEPTTSPERSDGPQKLCEDSADCGRSSGDPHLVTLDRTYYDFQAVGEFVVVRSTSGDALEVQARQSAFRSSRTVSINTALAFRIGEHTVSIALVDSVSQVHVDGELVVLPQGETPVPGGGRIVRRDSDTGAAEGYDIHWPDGSAAAVDQAGRSSYRLLVRLDPSRAGEVEGLLGDFDGDPSNDLTPRSGTPLALPASPEELYPSYADSWRIAQEASLFSYAGGEDTETFTDRTYPDRHLTIDDLDAAARARAASVCRWAGVTEPWLFNECVFDVGVTGRPEFAVSTAGTELVAAPVTAPIAATPIAAAALAPGGEDRLTFAGGAADAVFVDVVAPTLPNRCSPIRLLDPSGTVVGRGCTINGAGIIDRTTLAADGDYTVLIEGGEGGTGKAMVRVYASHDVEGTIEPNGAEVSAVIEQPGSVARYRFSGSAGQRVYLEAGSTLPNQCSPLGLFDEDGRHVASGCVINGTGVVEGTVLPADGTYDVVVDPDSRTIGTVRLRLFANLDQVGSITADGPSVVATIDAPGSAVRYEFTAAAGTSVTVAATDVTLPSQCSPLQLFDEDGGRVASGCVINGEGEIRSTVLPETGVYAIVVDPKRSATGSLTLSLRTTT